ncbi:hypothetical protein JW756_04965 [Candidatus Woesearchaeota archaeon]|nr:hypothetical protein [Candidatus Woesearchaeota archaeon]
MFKLKIALSIILCLILSTFAVNAMFTQPDNSLPNAYDPQQLNRYMFERGNPYKFTDPTGERITYAVEQVGADDIIGVYANGVYVGRVVGEARQTEHIQTIFGTTVSITTYDYDIQPGSKLNARYGTLTASSYDDPYALTVKLSDICAADKKNILRDENIEMVGAIAQDLISLVSLGGSKSIGIIKNVPSAISTLSNIFTGITAYQTVTGGLRNAIGFVPGGSIYLAATDKSGYTAFTPIPEYSIIGKRTAYAHGGTFAERMMAAYLTRQANKQKTE